MQQLLNKIVLDAPKHQILGKHNQILQLVILPKDCYVTSKNYNQYRSPNINVEANKKTPYQNSNQLLTTMIKLENNSDKIGYAGLVKTEGNILVINPVIFFNIWIKIDSILCVPESLIIQQSTTEYIKNWINIQVPPNLVQAQMQIFLQASGQIIEKELGKNESMIINRASILAYTDGVEVKTRKGETIVTGGGRIFLQMETKNSMFSSCIYQLMSAVVVLLPILIWMIQGFLLFKQFN